MANLMILFSSSPPNRFMCGVKALACSDLDWLGLAAANLHRYLVEDVVFL